MLGTTITGGGWGPGAKQYRTGFGGGLGPLPPQIQRQIDAQRRQQQSPQQAQQPGQAQAGGASAPRGDLANYMNQYYGQENFFSGDAQASKADYDQWRAGQVAQQAEQQAATQRPMTNTGAPPGTMPFHPQPNQSALMQQFTRMYGPGSTRTQDQYRQRTGNPYFG